MIARSDSHQLYAIQDASEHSSGFFGFKHRVCSWDSANSRVWGYVYVALIELEELQHCTIDLHDGESL